MSHPVTNAPRRPRYVVCGYPGRHVELELELRDLRREERDEEEDAAEQAAEHDTFRAAATHRWWSDAKTLALRGGAQPAL